MQREERAVVERAIRRVTEQAANADAIVDEATAAGLDGSDKILVSTKMLRAELLSVKADLERELEKVVLDCTACGRTVHYVGGLGIRAVHWAHAEPAPHTTPKLRANLADSPVQLFAPYLSMQTPLAGLGEGCSEPSPRSDPIASGLVM